MQITSSTQCKVCFKCGAEKPLNLFYKHKGMADGYLNKCKECSKVDVKKNRDDNPEYYKDYDKSRANQPQRVKARDEYAKTEVGYRNVQKAKNNYVKRNPKKRSAHISVGNAVRDGKLIRSPICETCKSVSKTEAHHCDYNKPLDVMWLCDGCHKAWHKVNTPVV